MLYFLFSDADPEQHTPSIANHNSGSSSTSSLSARSEKFQFFLNELSFEKPKKYQSITLSKIPDEVPEKIVEFLL